MQDELSGCYDPCNMIVWGPGNIDADPCFIDPGYWAADPCDPCNLVWAEGDYHLRWDSPCIDAGDNTAVPLDTEDIDGDGDTTERIPWDIDGNPRFIDYPGIVDTGVADPPDYPDIVDMGVYEVIPGDTSCNGVVDSEDLIEFCSHWLQLPCGQGNKWCGGADLDHSGLVDLCDFAILCSYWLMGSG